MALAHPRKFLEFFDKTTINDAEIRIQIDDIVMVRFPGQDWEPLEEDKHPDLWQWITENLEIKK